MDGGKNHRCLKHVLSPEQKEAALAQLGGGADSAGREAAGKKILELR